MESTASSGSGQSPPVFNTISHGGYRLLAATVNSLYSFWWDVTNDWGLNLLKSHAEDSQKRLPRRLVLTRLHTPAEDPDVMCLSSSGMPRHAADLFAHERHLFRPMLRPTLLFPIPVYLAVMVLNCVLRLMWLVRPLGVVEVKSHAGLANFCLQLGELIRRWIWVFIRVEWEMVKKCDTKLSNDADEPEMITSAAVQLIPAL